MGKLNEQFKMGEAFSYFLRVFKKADPSKPSNINIRMMHGINRISIVMFLFALCVIIYRYLTRY
jgi:hypothetical protein